MADDNTKDDDPTNTNRITPRDVEPDSRKSGGGQDNPSTGQGRSARRDPLVEEAGGGDISGVAGGGVDDHISGLGGDKNRR